MSCQIRFPNPRRPIPSAAVLLALWLGWGQVAAAGVSGVVFEDRNGNGRRDHGEPGIAGVLVSDQIHVVVSAADGTYQLAEQAGGSDAPEARFRNEGFVVVSLPDGYRSRGPLWRRLGPAAAAEGVDFPLMGASRGSEFTFMHASDTHLNEQSLERTRRLRELVVALRPDFVLLTGDLVADAPGLGEAEVRRDYELFVREIATFPVPVWTVPGNRELFGIERHKSLVSSEHPLYGKQMYRHYLGPDYYSFNYGGVHFIALDTVAYHELWYYGYVDATQLAWLEEDLAHVAAATTVVSFNHIPLISAGEMLFGYRSAPLVPSVIEVDGRTHFRHTVANVEAVLDAFRGHRFTLALGGHFHMRETLFYESAGRRTRYHLAAAVVGDLADAAGMRMTSGVTLYRVRDGEIDDGTFVPLDEAP